MPTTSPTSDPTPRCHRCGHPCFPCPVQNLTGWEGRQLQIERGRYACQDIEVCCARRFGSEVA